MVHKLTSLFIAACLMAPTQLIAESRTTSIAPIAQWGETDDDVAQDDGDTFIFSDGPIIFLGDGPGRRDERETRRDRFLPQACLVEVSAGSGSFRIFESDCLRNAHIENRELPNECSVTVRSGGTTVRGYDPGCLRDEGYRMAGR